MLTIRVIQPASDAALSARFGAEGGTIGRAPTCTLPLPDPDQHISRVQAEIRTQGGAWSIVNRGSVNPLAIGARSIGPGESHPLRDGDEIVVAQFVLRVELKATSSAGDPFGDLLPRTFVQPARGGHGAVALGGGDAGSRDAHGGLGRDGLLGMPSAPAAAGGHAMIPHDFDPLGSLAAPPSPAPTPASGRSPLGLPLVDDDRNGRGPGAAPAESIDLLFDLPGAGDPADARRDRQGLDGPRIASDASMSDHVPEIHSPMKLPQLDSPPSALYRSWDGPEEISKTVIVGRGDRAPAGAHGAASSLPSMPPAPSMPPSTPPNPAPSMPAARDASSKPPPAPASAADAALLAALVNDAADQHRRNFEPPPRTRPTELLDELNRRAGAPRPDADAQPGEPATGAEAPAAPSGSDAALIAAFLQGAGLAEWPRGAKPLDAAAMRRMGELMRLMVQGTIELLAARAVAKREMRAENTVIVARENNPLKFSPDASAALPYLLAAQAPRGFVDGRAAVADAFDDLLAHQAGVVAGMRAAMQGLVARFDPASLEKRLKDPSLLDTMLPMNRKARLWELFGELYGELSREAEDDFEALFGRAFRRAYEAQIEQLERRRPL